jgi:cytochrome c oxidase assembly factor CtaG
VDPGQAPERRTVILAAAVDYSWSFQPGALLMIGLLGGVYGWRIRDLRRTDRSPGRHDHARAAAFAAGLLVLFVALVSPIDTVGEERLFTVHMIQHLLLADVAPILLLLGLSRAFLRPAVRRLRPIEDALGPVAHPVTALVLFVATMWAWHLPVLYQLALDHPAAHALEHLMFFATGTAFWWFILEPVPPRHRLKGLGALAYMASAKLLMGALGVVLAFSPNAIYDTYEQAPRAWGLSAVADQNVGGVLMMLEQSIVLVIFFAILFARVLESSEQAERRRERFEDVQSPNV